MSQSRKQLLRIFAKNHPLYFLLTLFLGIEGAIYTLLNLFEFVVRRTLPDLALSSAVFGLVLSVALHSRILNKKQ